MPSKLYLFKAHSKPLLILRLTLAVRLQGQYPHTLALTQVACLLKLHLMIQKPSSANPLSRLNQCAGPITLLVISHPIILFRIFHLAGTPSPGQVHHLRIRRLIFINSIPDHHLLQTRNHPHCQLQWHLHRSPPLMFCRRLHHHHSKVFTRILVSRPTDSHLSHNLVKSTPLIPTWSYQTRNSLATWRIS